MLLLQEIDEYETGLSGVDHNIRHHPFSSSMVKRQEFDEFGFTRLYQYSEMFPRTFLTPVHTNPMPRARDAATIVEN